MEKLYKYRPLSEFLFKELYYQELYFASYEEINDPLDLSARIDFKPKEKEEVSYLIWFIFKTHLDFDEFSNPTERLKKILKFNKSKDARNVLSDEMFINIKRAEKENIWLDDIISIIQKSIDKTKIDIDFEPQRFVKELDRLTNKFLKNSYVTCFSETNNDFLMWSHYASKHSGICLEFSLDNIGSFPYEMKAERKADFIKYKERMSEWDLTAFTYWDRIRKVSYENEQPYVNFYKFSAVFENENDCDLIGFSYPDEHLHLEK